jgi:hypothetical protein
MNKVKPKADSALEASVKTSSDSPFVFHNPVLQAEAWFQAEARKQNYKQQPRTAELNRSFITKLSKIGKSESLELPPTHEERRTEVVSDWVP